MNRQVTIFTMMGEKQANRIRMHYLRSILRQDAAFFDTQASASGRLLTSIESDTHLLQEAMGAYLPLPICPDSSTRLCVKVNCTLSSLARRRLLKNTAK